MVGIYGNKVNPTEYILGDVFMQQFYVILDYQNYRFAMNGIYTPASEIKQYGFRDPDAQHEDKKPASGIVWFVIAAIVIVLAIVGIIGFVIIRLKNKNLQANLAKYESL